MSPQPPSPEEPISRGSFSDALNRMRQAAQNPNPDDGPDASDDEKPISDSEGVSLQLALMLGGAFSVGSGIDPEAIMADTPEFLTRLDDWMHTLPGALLGDLCPTEELAQYAAILVRSSIRLIATIRTHPMNRHTKQRPLPPDEFVTDFFDMPWSWTVISSIMAGGTLMRMSSQEYVVLRRFAAMAESEDEQYIATPEGWEDFASLIITRMRALVRNEMPILPWEIDGPENLPAGLLAGLRLAAKYPPLPPVPGGTTTPGGATPFSVAFDDVVRRLKERGEEER